MALLARCGDNLHRAIFGFNVELLIAYGAAAI